MNQIEIKDRGKQREATAKRKLKSVRGIKMRYLMIGQIYFYSVKQ
jgi:hypothetical protein